MGLLFRWVWGGKAHDRKRTWNGGPEIMEWSEDYSSRQRKSGNALWRPYFQSRYVTGMRGTSPKCATAYIISRSKTSKRNPPTVVLVRVRASSMMVETPKSPVDNKLQYDQKYFNNLALLILQISSLLDSEWPTYLLKYCHLQQEKCYLVWDLCQSYSKHKKENL